MRLILTWIREFVPAGTKLTSLKSPKLRSRKDVSLPSSRIILTGTKSKERASRGVVRTGIMVVGYSLLKQ